MLYRLLFSSTAPAFEGFNNVYYVLIESFFPVAKSF